MSGTPEQSEGNPAAPAAIPAPGPAPSPVAPAWAWAAQPQPTQVIETAPLEYHRLLLGVQGYKWWKPLLVVVIAAAFFGVLSVVLSLASIPVITAVDPSYLSDLASGKGEILDTQRPVSVVLSLLSIILMIPAVLLAMLVMGMRPSGRIWSVAVRIRWGMVGRFTGIAVLAVVAMNATGIALEMVLAPLQSAQDVSAITQPENFDVGAALLSLLFVVLLVPIQATAEEVVFRGLFMQVIGSWLKNPWFAIVIPTIAFTLLHIYDVWGLAAVALMGGFAAWLTWRTGGLEAAIAIHIVNNLFAFGFMTAGFGGSTAQTEEGGSLGSLIGELIGLSLFAWLVVRSFKKRGYGRTRIDLLRVPIAQQPSQPAEIAPTNGNAS